MQKNILLLLTLLLPFLIRAQDFRPPAYPLITVDPYFSIWSFSDKLNESSTVHWTGKDNSLQGIIRVDGKSYYFLGQPLLQKKTILPLTEKEGEWKFTNAEPGNGWEKNDFDDHSWKIAKGAFSDGRNAANKWTTKDLWARRYFNLNDVNFDDLLLNLHHDDNIEVFLNGEPAFKADGWNNSPELFKINEAARRTLRKGMNVMAIHCMNTAGGAYLDAGLIDLIKPGYAVGLAAQQNVRVSSTQTYYTFSAGGVQLNLKFTSPLLPDDPDIFSRPADYITFGVSAGDGRPHDVQIYFSAAGNLAVNTPDQEITWRREHTGTLNLLRLGTTSQNILRRKGDDVRIDWGYLYLAVPANRNTSTSITASGVSIGSFVKTGSLPAKDDSSGPRPAEDRPVTLAAAFDLGKIDPGSSPQTRHLILAYDQIYSIEYFHQKLEPWWKRNGMTVKEMLDSAESQYKTILERCDRFDDDLHQKTSVAGGEQYAKICELAYRQSMAAHKLVAGPRGELLFFSKENFSNGSIATVDVTYPSSPLLLMYNPALLKGLMIPILYYSQSGQYPYPYAAHDVGKYPVANGMTYGEPMPVEESGNMLILAAAVAKAEGNAGFAKKYWDVLSQWAHYLKGNGLDPANQLCTDDFAGHLAHNANLSVKAIMGLASYGYLAGELGMKDTAQLYIDLAKDYARQWMKMDADGDHYSLTFDKKGTWSQKYNLIWDKVLQLNIFPKEVAQKEIKFYLKKQNKYGIPLDSRKTYTKADWIIWTASLSDDVKTFKALSDPVYKYITETPSRVPVSDWYETTDGKQVGFQARSVVGGFFMKVLLEKWKE